MLPLLSLRCQSDRAALKMMMMSAITLNTQHTASTCRNACVGLLVGWLVLLFQKSNFASSSSSSTHSWQKQTNFSHFLFAASLNCVGQQQESESSLGLFGPNFCEKSQKTISTPTHQMKILLLVIVLACTAITGESLHPRLVQLFPSALNTTNNFVLFRRRCDARRNQRGV
jgi:hypothetical protein